MGCRHFPEFPEFPKAFFESFVIGLCLTHQGLQSKGHIKIYSEVGHGTSVKIYLPRSAEAQDSALSVAAEPMPLGTEHECILLIEDDPEVRASVLRQLRSLGYRVTDVDSGDAALALVRAGGFDAIVSDMVMPGQYSGLMMLEESARRWPKVGTILMTGYTENAMIQDGRLPEHVRLLIKPFTKAGLARFLRQAITVRRPGEAAGSPI